MLEITREQLWILTTNSVHVKTGAIIVTCSKGGSRGWIKIGSYGVIFYNLVILIKLYKIWYLNLDKALLFPRNQAICLKT